MIGKKRLRDVRASLLNECGKAGIDPARSFGGLIDKLEHAMPVNSLEVETLKLIRDGLQSKSSRAKRIRKRTRTTRSAD